MNANPPIFNTIQTLKKPKQKPRYWNEEEDTLLREAIKKHGTEGYHTWKEVAKHVPNRTYRECMQRWTKVLAPGLKKGKWSAEEDQLLIKLVKTQLDALGEGNGKRIVWNKVAAGFKGRSCKQCRERWINHLDPAVKKTEWTQEEDHALLQLFETMPNKWAKIARQIPGRTENMVKVRWNALNRQAKKRKQNSLYYGQPDIAGGINGYIHPMHLNGQPHPQYSQFYINNQFQLNLNQNSALARQNGVPIAPGAPGAEGVNYHNVENQVDPRKNSLYFFQQGHPDIRQMPMQMNSFPQLPNVGNTAANAQENPNTEGTEQGQYRPNAAGDLKPEGQQEGQQAKPASQEGRKDSLCMKENYSDYYKVDQNFPQTGNQPKLPGPQMANSNGEERRLSFTMGSFNFEEQGPNNTANQNTTEANNNAQGTRRYSSLVYQNLLHMNGSGEQEGQQQAGAEAKRPRVDNAENTESNNIAE